MEAITINTRCQLPVNVETDSNIQNMKSLLFLDPLLDRFGVVVPFGFISIYDSGSTSLQSVQEDPTHKYTSVKF